MPGPQEVTQFAESNPVSMASNYSDRSIYKYASFLCIQYSNRPSIPHNYYMPNAHCVRVNFSKVSHNIICPVLSRRDRHSVIKLNTTHDGWIKHITLHYIRLLWWRTDVTVDIFNFLKKCRSFIINIMFTHSNTKIRFLIAWPHRVAFKKSPRHYQCNTQCNISFIVSSRPGGPCFRISAGVLSFVCRPRAVHILMPL